MAVRDVLQIGNPKLKAKNKAFKSFNSPKLKQVIKDLVDTMKKNELVGIAGPQIGVNYKILVTQPRKTKYRPASQADVLRVYINPKIIKYSKKKNTIYEGCGSVVEGNLFGPVVRPQEIVIEAYDKHGKKFQLDCDGLLARVIQHEYDHLFGIEFTEIISDYSKLVNLEFYLKTIKKSAQQFQASMITKKEYKKLG